ncbi:hypothetical protein EPUL_000277 [Erysiphe pulchra]|uniref:Helitron helicase-like domain-containing protein n=1 Tax=Erysiphe pulchra TaxID=225359 RepID=A0A2S4Q0I9_9PEZI|nr:hypothetical protein EPUL_000277 [Erysiphe pulchra]
MFACVDDTVLSWHRLNQDIIRADLYAGVIDALRSDVANQNIGRPVILYASYHGDDRHIARCYQNAVAIVRYLGKPTKFLTFTANPSWQEITRCLEHGQTPDSRPDLIAIVFRLKLNAFLHDIKKRQVCGRYIGGIHVIEYQKRGLPHAHILLFLHEDDVPRRSEQVDEMVSAQMPTNCPALAEIVESQLTHGPCGPGYPNTPCMKNGRCSKGYPKRWYEATVLSEDSYPKYARPNNGVTWNSANGRFTFDNR